MKYAGLNLARQQAQQKANETKEPYCVCEEAGNYFPTTFKIALENRFNIKEIISGLSNTT